MNQDVSAALENGAEQVSWRSQEVDIDGLGEGTKDCRGL